MRGKLPDQSDIHAQGRIIPAHAGQTWGSSGMSRSRTDHPRACGANDPLRVSGDPVGGSSPRMRGKLCFRVRIDGHPLDHPRACGANKVVGSNLTYVPGSSPRMRGKRSRPLACVPCHRIIPAHAGQTRVRTALRRTRTDHPRACGANLTVAVTLAVPAGSSPRMRGKHTKTPKTMSYPRIIPAHAGQTTSTSDSWATAPDHPRACGANTARKPVTGIKTGSSPRMRGKRGCGGRSTTRGRIIPAHAGQTSPLSEHSSPRSDHPRACGANAFGEHERCGGAGSSPRMRGKHQGRQLQQPQRRIIPAHAGQTTARTPVGDGKTDHPRACGANLAGFDSFEGESGSSPRMRGKHTKTPKTMSYPRIIPAHAGQTGWRCPAGCAPSDHPRACGANVDGAGVPKLLEGSSPRMRGKRREPEIQRDHERIIPAHAGQTRCGAGSCRSCPDHPRACGANSPILCENS